jgi:ankyrin repeat protein
VAEYLARESRVAYYYCDYQKSRVQAATTVAASLLRQLLETGAAVPAVLVEMHKTLARTGQTLKLDDITSLLCRICADTPRVRVLVDGLDEYGTPRQRRQLLHLLGKLAASGARILVMSRPHVAEVGRMRPRPVALEIRSEVSDIRSYVKHMILESEGLFGVVEDDLKDEAVECVVRQADRMYVWERTPGTNTRADPLLIDTRFLLAVLQCALLGRLARRSEVKRAIRSLPSEIHGVYQQSMDRIEQDSPERRSLALAVLSWISHAKRPLSRPELLHALAIDPDSLWLNDDNVPSRELVVDVCAGLVVVDPGSGASRFAHHSVHEFFQQKAACQRWFPRAGRNIATACLAYLRLQDLDRGPSPSANDASALVSRYPLLRYAVRYWGHHVRDVRHGDVDMIALDFLGDSVRVALAARVLDADGEPGRQSEPMYPSENLAVQLAARAGALGVLELLLKQKHSPAGADASGRTPLHWAARGGFDDVVRVLLLAGGDADTPTADGRTPLHWAAKHGHADIVEHLLRCGADPARPTADGRTAIHWAASRGHTSVVAALLADGRVEAACRTRDGWTALHWAACGGERTVLLGGGKPDGHEETVRLLLEAGVFPCLRTGGGQTALHWAAASGNAVIVRLLMDYGAAVDCEDASDCSALLSHSYSHSGATTTLTLC